MLTQRPVDDLKNFSGLICVCLNCDYTTALDISSVSFTNLLIIKFSVTPAFHCQFFFLSFDKDQVANIQ